jgi:hypothetical protein
MGNAGERADGHCNQVACAGGNCGSRRREGVGDWLGTTAARRTGQHYMARIDASAGHCAQAASAHSRDQEILIPQLSGGMEG